MSAEPFETRLARAATLPAALYRGEEPLLRERERVFARSWQLVGRTADLAEPAPMALDAAVTTPRGHTVGAADIYQIYFHGPAYPVLDQVYLADGLVIGRMTHDLPPNTSPAEAETIRFRSSGRRSGPYASTRRAVASGSSAPIRTGWATAERPC